MQLRRAASPHAEHTQGVGVRGYLICGWQSQAGLVPVASGINVGCGEGWAVRGLLVLPTWYNQKGACVICALHHCSRNPACMVGDIDDAAITLL